MAAFEPQLPTIVAQNVQVRYTVSTNDPKKKSRGMKLIGNTLLGRNGKTTVRALRGVNFVAKEGEMVGIVGANGSGKSTFLRNVAGVEQPDRGRILVRYQPLLLGVSAALQPALSGSENVRLGCLAMGLTPEEAKEAFDYVVELSALGSAIHRPMGTYSSGMGARLRFAIALAARPKILLIDEALSTGDATFAERSERAMDEMLTEAGTVLLVNHAAKVIQELCTRAVWMHRGEILMNGPAEAVAEKYRWWAWNVAKGKQDTSDKLLHDVVRNAPHDDIQILEPELHERRPVPRHARATPKTKGTKKRHDGAKSENVDAVGLDSTIASDGPYLRKARSRVPDNRVPFLPKRATDSIDAGRSSTDPPPLRLRPSDSKVVLRAADPRDRASAWAQEVDLTGRRIESRARKLSDKSLKYQSIPRQKGNEPVDPSSEDSTETDWDQIGLRDRP